MSDLHISFSGKPEDLEAMAKALVDGQVIEIMPNGQTVIPADRILLTVEGDPGYDGLLYDASMG